jgi:SAM-dependent methyltransferase
VNATGLANYYAERANEYDQIYGKPERQEDIKLLAAHLTEMLTQRTVLEVACGTGYWTQFFAKTSKSITATDYNDEVLAIARSRLAEYANVRVQHADAFALKDVGLGCDAGFAGFWWSHLEKSHIGSFLKGFHATLLPGSRVVFADNLYVEGSSTPISRIDAHGNTYQTRRLSDGRQFEVLKNFPTEQEFKAFVNGHGQNIHFKKFVYFWCGWYDLPT